MHIAAACDYDVGKISAGCLVVHRTVVHCILCDVLQYAGPTGMWLWHPKVQ